MVLDVGLVLEQHQRLHHEALDQLDGLVLTQRQDLLVGEQVSGSWQVTQPLSYRLLERPRPKQFAWDGITSEIHRRGGQAFTAADRFRSSPRVATAIELAPPGRRLVLDLACHRIGAFLSLSGSTPTRTRREPERSIK